MTESTASRLPDLPRVLPPILLRPAAVLLLLGSLAMATAQSPAPASPAAASMLAQLPARIVPNVGQWDSPELFRVRTGGMQVFLEQRGWSFWLVESPNEDSGAGRRRTAMAMESSPARAIAIRMEFVGSGAPRLIPERPLAGTTSYLVGSHDRHRTGVPGHASVLYESMYEGIDVRFREDQGHAEYDLLLAPGADLAQVQVRVSGARALRLDASGALILETALGAVRQPMPTTWIEGRDGCRQPIECRYELRGADCFGFVAPARDPERPLVVDPALIYSTYIGGSGADEPAQIVTTGNGHLLLCGSTQSLNFPTTPGTIHPGVLGAWDGYVVRLDPTQPPASQVVFATYIGTSANDALLSVAALPGDLIAFSGITASTNLPVTAGAYQSTNAGINDALLGVIDGGATTLIAMTYFGGTARDEITSVVADPLGGLRVAGTTSSTTLPTTANAFSTTHGGGPNGWDGFVARFDLQLGNLLYSSFFGGSGDEWLFSWDVDAAGVMTMFGDTTSTNMPVTANAFDPTHNGGGTTWDTGEGYIARLDPSLPPAQQLRYCTYLGGSRDDWMWMARTTPNGEIVVSGTTTSPNFPTTAGAYQPTFRGGIGASGTVGDGFVARIDPQIAGGAGLLAGTLLGGVGPDQGLDHAIDSDGTLTLLGWSNGTSSNLPTTPDAMRRVYSGNDGYVARISRDCRQLLYCSLFGGSANDGVWLASRQTDGVVAVAGSTFSSNLPIVSAAQPSYAGGGDTFVSLFQLVPTDTLRRGRPTVGSNGHPTIHALGDAVSGNAQFGFACSRAPVNGAGFLVLAWQPAPGVSMFGIDVFVDTTTVALAALVTANPQGESTFALPIPAMVVPTFHAQYAWIENASPLTLSASDALQIR